MGPGWYPLIAALAIQEHLAVKCVNSFQIGNIKVWASKEMGDFFLAVYKHVSEC